MKIKKERKKDKVNNYNIKKSILILTMIMCTIIAMITYWIYAYYNKYGKFYFDDKIISYKIEDYIDVKGNMIYIKKVSDEINTDFVSRETSIINDNKVISTDIKKGIYGNILSLIVTYTFDNNKEEVLTLNINLKKGSVVTNDELLEKARYSYKNIATDIFNEYIRLPDDYNMKVIDSITKEEMTARKLSGSSEKYIIRIREKLPEIINLYIDNNKLNYVVNLGEIYEVCYYSDDNISVNIEKEIGKI